MRGAEVTALPCIQPIHTCAGTGRGADDVEIVDYH